MSISKNGQRSGLSLLVDRRIELVKSKAAIHPDNIAIAEGTPAGASDGRSGLSKRIDVQIASMRRK
ncbi:hypothetical protein [Neorhizobium galegae]|uniref:Uncharacterized protein n=1 Tax=Neorhizobium galegae bv. officinalis TaxID=323656 RepID=A0A0T7H0S4_NEOGA|nr:hypothetical protein [Neorhizobium galegae]CDZ53073.1 Hypothetical protein NGAL_HAMBI1189_48050 [Neorhizobium galegae bv. officinalis]